LTVSAPAAPAEPKLSPPRPPQRPLPLPQRPRTPAWADRAASAAQGRLGKWWPALVIGAVLSWVAFMAKGGLNLGSMTAVEMTLTIGSGVLAAVCVVLVRTRAPAWGAWSVALLLAFSALTALSVVWSVQPDASWQDAGRVFAFSAEFALAVTLARSAPRAWRWVLGGVLLAATAVCGWALLTKVFPNHLDATDPYARLRAPYDYWNAIGLTAAMGAVGCMWLGSRRSGHALLSALAYPAMGLMLVTLLLAYSRGALAALAIGLVFWFAVTPLRLRGAATLLVGGAGAAAVVAFAFSRHALSSDNVALAERMHAGHQLGVLLVAMLVALALAGVAICFQRERTPLTREARRRLGALVLAVLALTLVAGVGALAASHRGLTGSVSHAFHSLTDPHAPVPPNTPGRLTAIASVRARYWNEALKVFKAHPALGSGAEGYATARLRYRTETLDVRHAHGFVVQTLADLGVVGLALALALLVAWMAAAGRATHPFNRRWRGPAVSRVPGALRIRCPSWQRAPAPYSAERIGLLTMLALVVVFGVHSLVDWTWYVPGNACVALLCAGWLAGRGELRGATAAPSPDGGVTARSPARRRSARDAIQWVRGNPRPASVAGLCVAAALVAAWAQWQPQRSADASQHALALLARNPREAEAAARTAVARDPLSAQALFTLATVQSSRGSETARATLQRAVSLQPSNPQTWIALGQFDLTHASAGLSAAGAASAALREISAAIYLNPELVAPEAIARGNREAIAVQNDYVEALRSSSAAAAVQSPPASARRPAAAQPLRARRRARARR
jgi:O-Antigen ligase